LGQLQPHDRAAVSVFSSGARTIVPSQFFDSGVKSLRNARWRVCRSKVRPNCWRFESVYAEVAPHRSPDVTTFVILLSDGEPTDSQAIALKNLDHFCTHRRRVQKQRRIAFDDWSGSVLPIMTRVSARLGRPWRGQIPDGAAAERIADAFQDELGVFKARLSVTWQLKLSAQRTVRRFWRVVPDKKIFDPPKVVNVAFEFRLDPFKTISAGQLISSTL
jgi:hypothetical protein